MRSNDLLVGLPNNLIDARISQIILAACIGVPIGSIHYQSDLLQIYNPDVGGQYCAEILANLYAHDQSETEPQTLQKMTDIPIIGELSRLLSPFFTIPAKSQVEGLQRWREIMSNLEEMFWNYNQECKPGNRACVAHLIGRYESPRKSSEDVLVKPEIEA